MVCTDSTAPPLQTGFFPPLTREAGVADLDDRVAGKWLGSTAVPQRQTHLDFVYLVYSTLPGILMMLLICCCQTIAPPRQTCRPGSVLALRFWLNSVTRFREGTTCGLRDALCAESPETSFWMNLLRWTWKKTTEEPDS